MQLQQTQANQNKHSRVTKFQQGNVSARHSLGKRRFLVCSDGFIDHAFLQEIETVGLGIGRLFYCREQSSVKFRMLVLNIAGKFLVINIAARRVDE